MASAAAGADSTASTTSDKGETIDKGEKGKLVTQEGVITAPVTVASDKHGGVVVAFKVTKDGHVQAWFATSKTIVVKDGKVVPPNTLAKGDHVTVSGIVQSGEKGTVGQAFKVVIHGDDGDGSKGDDSQDG